MPSILSLEASTSVCSVALSHQGVTDALFESAPKSHTQKMLPMADQLLTSHNLVVSQLDAVAFACGPGSFTGLRIATSVAQGLAFGADLPVIAVSTLEAMAWGAKQEGLVQTGQICVTCLDAKMDEVYFAAWKVDGDQLVAVSEEILIKPEMGLNALGAYSGSPIVILGDGADLLDLKTDNMCDSVVTIDSSWLPHAKYISDLANIAWARGDTQPPELAEPTYLRGKNAWKTVAEQGKIA